MTDDYKFFSIFLNHTLLVEEVDAVYNINIFTI